MRFSSIVLFSTLVCIAYSMTDKQMQSAAKLIRNLCQPKLKLTNDDISNIHKGIFDRPNYKCYTECVLRSGQCMKDGKFDYDAFMKQVNILENLQKREAASMAGAKCKNAAKSSDKCEAAYEVYSCIYRSNPEHFFLP